MTKELREGQWRDGDEEYIDTEEYQEVEDEVYDMADTDSESLHSSDACREEQDMERDEDVNVATWAMDLPDCARLTVSDFTDSVTAVAISPADPNIVAAGGMDESFRVYHLVEGNSNTVAEPSRNVNMTEHLKPIERCLQDLRRLPPLVPRELFVDRQATDTVAAIEFSVDGGLVAAASMDSKIRVYDCQSSDSGVVVQFLRTLEGPTEEIEWIRWHPKGAALLAGSTDNTVWLWWVPTARVMQVYSGHGGAVSCGKFAAEGHVIVSGAVDGSLICWDARTGAAKHKWHMGDSNFHEGPIITVDCSSTHLIAASGSDDCTVRVVNLETGQVIARFGNDSDPITTVQFHPSQPLLATGSMDGRISVWDVSKNTQVMAGKHVPLTADGASDLPCAGITKVIWSPRENSPVLITAGLDGTVRVWDVRNGACLRVLTGHSKPVAELTVADIGSHVRVVTGSDDNSVKVFDVAV